MTKTFLFDMDEVIVEFIDGFFAVATERHPNIIVPEKGTVDVSDMTATVEGLTRQDARAIIDEAGFFTKLTPMKDAIETLNQLLAEGYDIRICTAPAPNNPTCVEDKIAWVVENMGEQWADRIDVVLDKTTIKGDYLFDDKGNITGVNTPTWEHIVWDHFSNRSIEGKRRIYGWHEVRNFIITHA